MEPEQHDSSLRSSNGSDAESSAKLQWAAIERLPTFERIKASLFELNSNEGGVGRRVVDVTQLGALERHVFMEKLLTKIEQDNHVLLHKLKKRIHRVGLKMPTVEVRFKNLCIEAESEVVHGRSLPTLWNSFKHTFSVMRNISGCKPPATKIKILKNVSGVIKPSRMTLLLGPPGCGKTTLLQALAGKSDPSLQVMGEISYNGYKVEEIVPQKTSAYVSQNDLHISELTVRETLDFSARCQGIGTRADIMVEVSKREKQAGIIPEPDIDTYMKAVSVKGLKRTLQTDYILKILGLDTCADTIVGDAMTRGISGGQKKRLTTGEMMMGPTKALLMDEISNGLDSSTTFQIVTCLQQLSHISESTILVSLLQPSPETFDLFDDVILMAQGKIVYHGPRDDVVDFFGHCGFKCPPRKGIADFLQEVVSEKDQGQYWYHDEQTHEYVSVDKFVKAFHESHVGHKLDQQMSQPFIRSESHKKALITTNVYSMRKWELFKACMSREWLLMKRNSFVHVFKSAQLMVVAIVTMTIFIRTNMKTDIIHANYYMGSLFYSLLRLVTNGIAELSLTVSRLSVFYKQRDLHFYPPWSYAIPSVILKIPFSLLDAFLWTALTYYVIGYSPEPERFLYQFLVFFLVHLVSQSLFRMIASLVRSPPLASASALYILLVMFLFGGFIIPQSSMSAWLQWGFWISPLTYAEIALSLNEFLAPRWQKGSSSNGTIGDQVLRNYGLHFSHWFYMISVGALLAFWIFFNFGFTCALTFLGTPSRSRTMIISQQNSSVRERSEEEAKMGEERLGTVLPFEPTSISFQNVHYFVDTPKKLRGQGMGQKKLQLLEDISGAFRPGVLTALMGVSGAGKTTLMDVLSGRKTGGVIEGEIRVGGYLKVQETYARISGYCEQTDIHSSQLTVQESVMYSAKLRLPPQIDKHKRLAFVGEVLRMLELDEIKDGLVGINGASGISNEQRKRLTIAVELVSNPSIIFMDEPTTGLDARAAAIVMRVVKNIVTTGRTVVCTIHQPSIHIFEAFDELILLKQGGRMIYSGEIGQHSCKLIQYFESIGGVPKVKDNYNPATWMLEVTSPSSETQLGIDFAHLYRDSHQFKENEELAKELNAAARRSELKFSSQYPQNGWEQFKACLWKLHLSYWRSPNYNLVRLMFIAMSSLLFAALLWRKGQEIRDEQDLSNILGAMFLFMQLSGICNCSTVLPHIAKERNVLYRERFAGMYSSWAYSIAQVTIEIPYIFLQTVVFVAVTYPSVSFYWSAHKVLWYMYTMLCTLLYYNYLGMLLVSLTPSFQVASVLASFVYTMLNLFSGFLIPGPKIPKWWGWCYWICPTAWSLKGVLISQYGDVKEEIITVNGERKAINEFLASYYGYHNHDLGIVAIVLLAFPLVFAFTFSYCIANINFQKR